MKFIVSYALPYEHRVMVGIEAESEEEALEKAQAEFDEGTLWADTETMPLLLDEYEEVEGGFLDFGIEQALPEGGVYPPPDASVLSIRQDNAARQAAALLVAAYEAGEDDGGSIAWEDLDEAYAAALKAVGR